MFLVELSSDLFQLWGRKLSVECILFHFFVFCLELLAPWLRLLRLFNLVIESLELRLDVVPLRIPHFVEAEVLEVDELGVSRYPSMVTVLRNVAVAISCLILVMGLYPMIVLSFRSVSACLCHLVH